MKFKLNIFKNIISFTTEQTTARAQNKTTGSPRNSRTKNTPEYKSFMFFTSKLSGIFPTDKQKTANFQELLTLDS